jgi:hypothetical protein
METLNMLPTFQHTDSEESLCLQAGVKKEGQGSSMIKVRSPKLNAAENFGSSRKSTLTLMTAEQPEGVKRRRKACSQDFGGTTRVETQKQQSEQDAQTSQRERV